MTQYMQPQALADSGQEFCIVSITFAPNANVNSKFYKQPEIQYKIVLMGEDGLYEERLVTFFARQVDGVTPHNHNMQQAYLLREQLPAHLYRLVQNANSKNYTFKPTGNERELCPCHTLQRLLETVEQEMQQAIGLDKEVTRKYTIEELRGELKLQQHIIAAFANVKVGRVSEACRNQPSYINDLRNILAFLNKKREEKGYNAIPEHQMEWTVKA